MVYLVDLCALFYYILFGFFSCILQTLLCCVIYSIIYYIISHVVIALFPFSIIRYILHFPYSTSIESSMEFGFACNTLSSSSEVRGLKSQRSMNIIFHDLQIPSINLLGSLLKDLRPKKIDIQTNFVGLFVSLNHFSCS